MYKKIRKAKHKSFILLVLCMGLAMIVTACGGNTVEPQPSGNPDVKSESENGDKNEIHKVTVMSHFFGATPPNKGNEVEKKIVEKIGVDLDIQWVSFNNYEDKFNVTLASTEVPDLILVRDLSPTFRSAVKEGMFWDVAPYIDDYPNLKAAIPDVAWELTSINGGNYGIPRPRATESDTFFIIRKDWLDKVGLAVPSTAAELYEAMKAFSNADFDGNGKQDTYGFAGQISQEDMGSMMHFESMFTGTNGLWKEDNGELIFTALLPELREALSYIHEAYVNEFLPEDIASMQTSQAQELFQAGKAGIVSEKTNSLQKYYESLSKIEPDLKMEDLLPLTNINGFNPKSPGYAGMNAIPKSVSEDKLKAILSALDQWVKDDVYALQTNGIEGVHHTIENGEIVLDQEKIQTDQLGAYNQIVYVADLYGNATSPLFSDEVNALYSSIQDERAKTSVADISVGLYSETAQTYLPELLKDLQDMKTKVILGSASLTDWDAFVEKLQANERFIMINKEMNEAYRQR